MVNYFFIIIFIISLLYGILSGNVNIIQSSLLTLPKESILVFFKMSSVLIFFQGILEIAQESGIVNILAKLSNKVIKPLFPNIKDKDTINYISLNLICNFFGIGQASTSLGFKAMDKLKEKSLNDNLSREILTFLMLNTSGLCLIPQTIIALREGYLSSNSSIILIPSFIVSLLVFIIIYIYSYIRRYHEVK